MSGGWDEEWETPHASERTRPPKRAAAGMGGLFGGVAALAALMLVITRWHDWTAPAPAAGTVTAAMLVASAQDRESAHFAPCKGPDRVTCVVDGDTLWFNHEKIRISDINAPEIGHPQCDSELELGEKATRRLIALLNAGRFSVVARESRDTDKYGRKLRILTRGGISIGMVLVSEGLAERWVGFRRNWCAA